MGLGDWIYKKIVKPVGGAIGDVFDPTGDDREAARKAAGSAVHEQQRLQDQYPDFGANQLLEVDNPNNPYSLRTYDQGTPESAAQEKFLGDPWERVAAGLAPDSSFSDFDYARNPSAWQGAESAYGNRDPSAFGGLQSEYGNLGPSAFNDLQYDQGARSRMEQGGDYFGQLASGESDPIAEAQYQRRVAEAEGSRKANTDAALAAEEARGADSGSNRLLAELKGGQDSVSDQYLAGLDANAMAAGRRDMAARSGADIGQMIGSGQLAADQARAGGLDQYGMQRAAGMDTAAQARAQGLDVYSGEQAAGQDQFTGQRNDALALEQQNRRTGQDDWANQRYEEYYGAGERNADRLQGVNDRNSDRAWKTSDANTDIYNNANTYNLVARPQQEFENQQSISNGIANAYTGQANTITNNTQFVPNFGEKLFQAGANTAAAGAGRK